MTEKRTLLKTLHVVFLITICAACGGPPTTPLSETPLGEYSSAASPPASVPTSTTQPYTLPLSAPGPYFPGKRNYNFEDPLRANRPVDLTVWYPAIKPVDFTGKVAKDALPDAIDAPYPLIISSTKMGQSFAPHLVSYGFTWVGVDHLDAYAPWDINMVDQPLDLLFALEQAGADKLAGLSGVIDAEHAGVTGYSFDGYNALALSGARLDPGYYLGQCQAPAPTPTPDPGAPDNYFCAPAEAWDEFQAAAGPGFTTSSDGLWQAMSDPRIRAVIPMAAEGWILFGERGLGAVDHPVLMLDGSQDDLYPENRLIFEHLGSPDRTFITFLGQEHLMIFEPIMVDRMRHFATAFFGYLLQGREQYKQYFSAAFVAKYSDLAWGFASTEQGQ